MNLSSILRTTLATGMLTMPYSLMTAQEAPNPNRYLFHERPLTEDIRDLWVSEQLENTFYKSDIISVDLTGVPFPDDAFCKRTGVPGQNSVCGQYLANPDKFARTHLRDLSIQIWVLKTDGTALAQKSKSGDVNGWICNGGECTDTMKFFFEHVPPSKIAALVIRVNGKLILRPIQTAQ